MSATKFVVEFEREVSEDQEFAVSNYPEDSLPEALRKQFKGELDQRATAEPGQLPEYTLDRANIDIGAGTEFYTVTFDCGERKQLTRDTQRAILRDSLQYHYDTTGMAGFFNIRD